MAQFTAAIRLARLGSIAELVLARRHGFHPLTKEGVIATQCPMLAIYERRLLPVSCAFPEASVHPNLLFRANPWGGRWPAWPRWPRQSASAVSVLWR
jgi:hypothetical protein